MRKILFKTLVFALFTVSAVAFIPASNAADANPYGGAKVSPPAPTEIILIISKGSVTKKLSMNDLKAMKSSTITIHEPFVKKIQSFKACTQNFNAVTLEFFCKF